MKPSPQPYRRLLFSAAVLGVVLLISGCNLLTSTEDRFRQAVEHREKGELNAAAIEFKNVLKKEPDHAQAQPAGLSRIMLRPAGCWVRPIWI